MGKRRWTDNQLVEAFHNSINVSEILTHLGLAQGGGTYKAIKNALNRLNLKFDLNSEERRIVALHKYRKQYTDEEVFSENGGATPSVIKERYTKLTENIHCEVCKLGSHWNGKSLTLQLDHINGDRSDNRRENLRLICPNCHSQTRTYGGKNIRNGRVK